MGEAEGRPPVRTGQPYLRAQAGCTATGNLFFSLGFSIYLVYVVRALDLSPGVVGLVLSLGSIGSLVAAFTARRISGRFGVGPTMVAAAFAEGPALLLIPLAPTDNPIPVLIVAQLISGLVVVVYNILAVSYRQALCPERLQGRMNSVMRFLVWGTIPLGTLAGGALATWVGLRETLVIAGIGAASSFLWLLLSPMRSVREMPTGPVERASA